MEITIVNQVSELARVAGLLDQFAAERHLAAELVADMHVALDEVLNNVTRYAYPDSAEHKIHIRLRLLENVLEAVVEDSGVPFDPLAIPAPDVSARLHERRLGGVGIHFVRNLLDEVIYERRGEINHLVLRKRINLRK